MEGTDEEMHTRKITLIRKGPAARASVREFELIVDEIPEKDGTNKGPRPTEYLLISLAGCYSNAFLRIAQKRKLNVKEVKCEITGHVNKKRMDKIDFILKVVGSPTMEQLNTIKKLADSACTIKNSLNSEVKVSIERLNP